MNTPMQADVAELSRLRNHFYLHAERLWRLSLGLAIVMLTATVLGLWIDRDWAIASVGVAALLVPIAATWLREAAGREQLRGDKCRRLVLEANGLGRVIPAAEMAEVHAWGVGQKVKAVVGTTEPYFMADPTLPPGPQRLADMTAESSFFTEFLARKIQSALQATFIGCIAAAVVGLFLLDLAAALDRAAILLVAKSAAVFLAFLISGDFLLLAKKFGDLASEARHAHQRFDHFRQQPGITVEEVSAAVQDYGVAVLQAPPIPNWLYGFYRDELNAVYKKSRTR